MRGSNTSVTPPESTSGALISDAARPRDEFRKSLLRRRFDAPAVTRETSSRSSISARVVELARLMAQGFGGIASGRCVWPRICSALPMVRAGCAIRARASRGIRLAPVCFKQLFVCQPQLRLDALDRGDIQRDMPGAVDATVRVDQRITRGQMHARATAPAVSTSYWMARRDSMTSLSRAWSNSAASGEPRS